MRFAEDERLAPHPVLREHYADEPERRRQVDGMFDASAGHYDWISAVMSLGSGRWYRRQALERAGLRAGDRVLDAGAGTGLLAESARRLVGEAGHVVALDPSRGMLARAGERGIPHRVQALGEALPFADAAFDHVTMGYALRHVADLGRFFGECRRVLAPGGRMLLLEITRPEGRVPAALLGAWLRGVVPNLALVARRSPQARRLMRYHWDTIEHCVRPEAILAALAAAGFEGARRHVVLGTFSEYRAARGD